MSFSKQLLKAINFFHKQGFLHNDIHSNNVLIRDGKVVKLIDFGKVTMQLAPLKYRIVPGSERQKRYNRNHTHLAYELRNILNSKQSIKTDIYSIGHLFENYFSHGLKNRQFTKIIARMKSVSPDTRPDGHSVLSSLENIIL